MKKYLAILCLSVICPIIAKAQFDKTAYGQLTKEAYGRPSGNAYIQSGLKFGIDIDNGYNIYAAYDLSVMANAGYQFNPYFYCGLSVGSGVGEIEFFADDYSYNYYAYFGKFIIAADFRSYLTKTRVAPMLSFNIGYMFCHESQLYVSGGAGIRLGLTRKSGISMQFVTEMTDYYPVVGVRLGFDF